MAEDKATDNGNGAEYRAVARNVRMAPRKVRLVVDLIRGKNVVQALGILDHTTKRPAPVVKTLLKSAIANAEHLGQDVAVDELTVRTAYVDPGPVLKRFRPRAMGRATPVLRRSSHITLTVG